MKTQKIISFLADFFRFDFFLNEFKKYAHFGGRTGRKEYWIFILTGLMVYIGFAKMAFMISKPELLFLFEVIMFAPVLSATVRRLHDVGKSGYLIPFCLTACVVFFFSIGLAFQNEMTKDHLIILGYIALLIALYPFFLLFKKSSPDINKYDTMPSQPYRHGLMAITFILFLNGVIFLLQMHIANPQILTESSAQLTPEELLQVDKIVQEYKAKH